MSIAYLDKHIAVYLHDGLVEEFSSEAKRQIEINDLLISPMVLLEFEYLFERKKCRECEGIVAHAKANRNAKLITRDRLIRQNYRSAVW